MWLPEGRVQCPVTAPPLLRSLLAKPSSQAAPGRRARSPAQQEMQRPTRHLPPGSPYCRWELGLLQVTLTGVAQSPRGPGGAGRRLPSLGLPEVPLISWPEGDWRAESLALGQCCGLLLGTRGLARGPRSARTQPARRGAPRRGKACAFRDHSVGGAVADFVLTGPCWDRHLARPVSVAEE